MCFMQPPQPRHSMLQTMKHIDVQIVSYEEQRKLHPQRPVTHQMQTRQLRVIVDETNQGADEKPHHVALSQGIQQQIAAELTSQQTLPPVVRPFPLEQNVETRRGN